jgi:multidrug efflux pump subunit AcrB
MIALKSKTENESILYDVARYEVRNMVMQNQGASAPVVIGGQIRAVMLYVDRTQLQARDLSPAQVMKAVDEYNVFFPAGDVKIGNTDYALASNSMFNSVERMKEIPLIAERGKFTYLGDVAESRDSHFIQTNVVRVDGRRQVYIPVYRQVGASTLTVVNALKDSLADMEGRLSRSDIDLKLVMDQSVYVKASIGALVQEAGLGAVLCSLVILLFLGEWRMTLIAIITLPLSVLVAIICLHYTGNTINVMTLAGLTLAIGPMIDSAIICLENTHRYLGLGKGPNEAALIGASEVAMPELVSTLCTFLVLLPLALVPGMGRFLFLPMTLAVMFSMCTAYLLSRTLVPCFSAFLLSHHGEGHGPRGPIAAAFARWEQLIERGIALYTRTLDIFITHRVKTIVIAYILLAGTLALFAPILRRDFFPEVDSGAFDIAARAPSGTRIEVTEQMVERIEHVLKDRIDKEDLELIVSELGLTADWSAAYTPNAGTMDSVVHVQLTPERKKSAQEYIRILREAFKKDPRLTKMDFSFDAGGIIRGALNEGKSSPINIQVVGKNQTVLFDIADAIRRDVNGVDGIKDARVLQRLDGPALVIDVDRTKASGLGLAQEAIMRNVIAATNSSITYNKKNFWIDPLTHNQYYVGVQYHETEIDKIDDLENLLLTSPIQDKPVPLSNVATIHRSTLATEVHHINTQPTIDLTMNVEGRDLGHVANDVARVVEKYGKPISPGVWVPYDPGSADEGKTLAGSKLILAGEYSRMQETFRSLAGGLILASMLIYFLMVGLDKSFIVPLTVMLVVPLSLIGVIPMLWITGSALNVQSLLGIIFIVGIKVANTVLMTDYAQELRRHEGLTPKQAIRKAASLRVRPVTMTALAAFFAMIPTSLALEKGSEANAPLARAILGGLLAGEPATLFVLPALYSLMVRDKKTPGHGPVHEEAARGHGGHAGDERITEQRPGHEGQGFGEAGVAHP